MVSTTLLPKIFFALFSLLFLFATVQVALASSQIQVQAFFDSPSSSLASIQVVTPEAAICKYDLIPQEYSKMIKTFEQTGDQEHEQRVVIRETTRVHISCANLHGEVYEATSIQLHAPLPPKNIITGEVVSSSSNSNSFLYLVGLVCITTLLGYTVMRKPSACVEKAYKTLPHYQAVHTKTQLPTLSTTLVQNLLHQAHKEIDTQHFQESLTKYKYVLHLLDTHQLENPQSASTMNPQIQTLYYKLNLYNQLLWAHKHWTRNSQAPLRQTLGQIQKTYNTLRQNKPSSLLNNAYKSYAFYEKYLKHTK
ncbi:MAG: hypothetical protein AABX70_01645 [Nanoarchaeota archaeon]